MGNNQTASHLSLEEREIIAKSLSNGMSFQMIAEQLSRHPSTISREVKRHKEVSKKRIGFNGALNHTCQNISTCSVKHLCSSCTSRKYCKYCVQRDCTTICKKFIKEYCPIILKPPYVCNSCNRKTSCRFEKFYYRANSAQRTYLNELRESRQGINLEPEELNDLDDLVSPLVLKGQSIAHIYANHAQEIPCSIRTLYEYVELGLLSITNMDLRRKVSYKKRKRANKAPFNRKYRVDRTYEDFLKFTGENPDADIFEMDTVEGKKGEDKVLLTLYSRNFHFMLAYILEKQNMECVLKKFDWLEEILGIDLFHEICPVILTDNGAEFNNPISLETPLASSNSSNRTSIFYCDPGKAYQKGGIEKNHELIRYVIPKGKSLEPLTQEDISLVIDHINSYSRNQRALFTPFELMEKTYPDLIEKLGLKRINPDDILLSPKLLKRS